MPLSKNTHYFALRISHSPILSLFSYYLFPFPTFVFLLLLLFLLFLFFFLPSPPLPHPNSFSFSPSSSFLHSSNTSPPITSTCLRAPSSTAHQERPSLKHRGFSPKTHDTRLITSFFASLDFLRRPPLSPRPLSPSSSPPPLLCSCQHMFILMAFKESIVLNLIV